MLHRGEALLGGRKLLLLQLHESAHVVAGVAVGELEHRVVERVEAGEGDELELVSHGAELALELRDGGVIEVALPVERRRAVVGEHLFRIFLANALRKAPCKIQVRSAGLAPHHVRVFSVGEAEREDRKSTRLKYSQLRI